VTSGSFSSTRRSSRLAELKAFDHADPGTVFGVIEESGRFMADVLGPLNRVGDTVGAALTAMATSPPRPGSRRRTAVRRCWLGGGALPSGFGGRWVPVAGHGRDAGDGGLRQHGVLLVPAADSGPIDMLTEHASPGQQAAFLEKMVSGEWTGTMNLTEPQPVPIWERCVQVRAGRRRQLAHHRQKIFITFGEHDWLATSSSGPGPVPARPRGRGHWP